MAYDFVDFDSNMWCLFLLIFFVDYCTQKNDVGADRVATESLPRHSRVVVCGGGIVGSSIAYHLTLKGEHDVLLIDKGR